MAPTLCREGYRSRPLYSPPPSSIHIIDLIHSDAHHQHRTSDLVTGMLLVALQEGFITRAQAAWFTVPINQDRWLRTSTYENDGHPFVGPDGLAIWLDANGPTVNGLSSRARQLLVYCLFQEVSTLFTIYRQHRIITHGSVLSCFEGPHWATTTSPEAAYLYLYDARRTAH
jgi:hypothetical protein